MSTADGPADGPGSSYSTVLCSDRISAGGALSSANEAGRGDQPLQSGQCQRPDCMSTEEKRFSAPPQTAHRTGSCSRRAIPSTVFIGM